MTALALLSPRTRELAGKRSAENQSEVCPHAAEAHRRDCSYYVFNEDLPR